MLFRSKILKSGARPESPSSAAALVRRGLVALQFVISILLIVGSLIITDQLSFIQHRNLGLEKEQVVVMPVNAISAESYSTLKTELLRQHVVAAVSASFSVPGERVVIEEFRPQDAQESYYPRLLLTDFYFPETYGFKIKEGRSFSDDHGADSAGAYLLNEKAVALFGWTSAVGKHIDFPSQHRGGEVVGVVKDFNFASLHSEVEPLLIYLYPNPVFYKYISMKLASGDKREAINTVEDIWKKVLPGKPFEYSFLDESFRSLYQSETKLQAIVTTFTVIGIFIACLGLVGLVAQVVAQRTKEIGVRKVMGATIANIGGLIAKDFMKLVMVANVVAWPVGWYAMNRWLERFAYRVDVTVWVFVLAGFLALLAALFTISIQVIRAALANPVDALRYE